MRRPALFVASPVLPKLALGLNENRQQSEQSLPKTTLSPHEDPNQAHDKGSTDSAESL